MATSAFCTICQRTVYLGSDDDGCPVCSTPLVEHEDAASVTPVVPPAPA